MGESKSDDSNQSYGEGIYSCRVAEERLSKGAICQKAWIPTFTALYERGYINDSPYHPGLPSA